VGYSSFRDRALGDPPSPLEHIDHLFHQTSRRIWLGVLAWFVPFVVVLYFWFVNVNRLLPPGL